MPLADVTPSRRGNARTQEPRSAAWGLATKIGVGVVGILLIIAGIIMCVIPGPGLLTIFAGLALLATEFPWARRLMVNVKVYAKRTWRQFRQRRREARQKQSGDPSTETSASTKNIPHAPAEPPGNRPETPGNGITSRPETLRSDSTLL